MNVENIIILINGEDKTEEVLEYNQIAEDKIQVTFKDNTISTYSNHEVQWITEYTEINPQKAIIFENGVPISDISKIVKFEKYNYIRIILIDGSNKLYSEAALHIEQNGLDDPVCQKNFTYLKELSNYIPLEENNEGISKLFELITVMNPYSVLVNYLNPKTIKKMKKCNSVIYPFGFNVSQKEAVEKALNNQISIIDSSSITSKTEGILNIVANAVIEDKSVAIVTNSDFAALKFIEMLKQYRLDFIAARLEGNEDGFSDDKYNAWLELCSYDLENENLEKTKENLISSRNTLEEMLENQDKLAVLEIQYSNLVNEISDFQKEDIGKKLTLPSSLLNLSCDKILSFLEEYTILIRKYGYINFLNKMKFFFKYNILTFSFYNNSAEIIEKAAKARYNSLKLSELKEEMKELENKLEKCDIEDEIEKYKENSMDMLKKFLYKRFNINNEKTISDEDMVSNKLEDLVNKHPVIINSITSFINCVSDDYLFDYLIIDEASDVDVVTGALALLCARNVVIINDLNQLPKVIDDETKKISDEIYSKHVINEGYKYSDNSLLSSINKLFSEIPKTVLMGQYRNTRKIRDFNNRKFY